MFSYGKGLFISFYAPQRVCLRAPSESITEQKESSHLQGCNLLHEWADEEAAELSCAGHKCCII